MLDSTFVHNFVHLLQDIVEASEHQVIAYLSLNDLTAFFGQRNIQCFLWRHATMVVRFGGLNSIVSLGQFADDPAQRASMPRCLRDRAS